MTYNPELRQRCFEREYRFGRLNALRTELGLDEINMLESDEQGVSIGLEIEMTWWQAFPGMQHWHAGDVRPYQLQENSDEYRQFSREYDAHDRELRPLLEKVETIIPRVGIDAYWEFSFLPTLHREVLEAEVATLYDLGILRPGHDYATHLTVADIDNERDAAAILMACELVGGTTPERILAPFGSQKGSWGRRPDTTGGLRRRQNYELYGDTAVGYEFRTLVTASEAQISDVLSLVQELAGLQQEKNERWYQTRSRLEKMLYDAGLPVTEWPRPVNDEGLYRRYAKWLSAMDVTLQKSEPRT